MKTLRIEAGAAKFERNSLDDCDGAVLRLSTAHNCLSKPTEYAWEDEICEHKKRTDSPLVCGMEDISQWARYAAVVGMTGSSFTHIHREVLSCQGSK